MGRSQILFRLVGPSNPALTTFDTNPVRSLSVNSKQPFPLLPSTHNNPHALAGPLVPELFVPDPRLRPDPL